MEHKSADALREVAEVSPFPPVPMNRRERLERWADLLDRDPDARINLVRELEFAPESAQAQMRADYSALAVAFADPLFRAHGLASDRVGDGMDFFGLNDRQAHRLLCSCMHGMAMRAGDAARLVRQVANPTAQLMSRGLMVGAVCAIPALMFLLG